MDRLEWRSIDLPHIGSSHLHRLEGPGCTVHAMTRNGEKDKTNFDPTVMVVNGVTGEANEFRVSLGEFWCQLSGAREFCSAHRCVVGRM